MSQQKRRDWRGSVIGMAMGDGGLYQNPFRDGSRQGNYKLDIAHCAKQLEYLKHKKEIVNQIFEYDIPIREKIVTNKQTGKTYMAYRLLTRTHSRISFIAKNIYIDGKKRITDWVLDNITDEGVAYWWMDDGCVHLDKRPDRNGGQIIWALYGFPEEDVAKLRDWIATKYDVHLNLLKHMHGGPYLKRGMSEGRKLLDALREYSVPCMDYKFNIGQFVRPFYNLKPFCYSADHPTGMMI
jgi:hypothetical protein